MFSPSVRNYYLDTYYVEIMTLNELRKRGLFSGYEEELGLIFYVKAFVEPVRRMLSNEHGILYDKDIVRKITNTMLKYFPDIMLNPYILQDTSDYNKTFPRGGRINCGLAEYDDPYDVGQKNEIKRSILLLHFACNKF